MRKRKRPFGLALLVLLLFALFACQKQTVADQMKILTKALEEKQYAYTIAPLSESGSAEKVPIFDETVWYNLTVNGEELLVYFDSSNRAKQLAQQFCSEPEDGKVATLGLGYILLYRGTDESIIGLLDEWSAK